MVVQLTLKEILDKAIEKEIESQHLYNDLSHKMIDEAAKNAFQELVKQEQSHQKLLEDYLQGKLRGEMLGTGQIIDYKIAEQLEQPVLSPEMKLKDVFLAAANRERASHEFYLRLAQIHPTGEVKRLIEGLAAQELEHKQKVEFLYTEVAFPQTNGG